MKKIIALLLVLGCIFVFASCDNNGGKDNTDKGGVDISKAISDLQAALDASAPDAADITVVLESSLGNLNGSYNVVFNEDGTATVTYSYEKFNGFEESSSSNEIKSTYTSTTTVAADGTVTDSLGGVASVEAISFDIQLDESKLSSVVAGAGSISAKVKAADTKAILGVEIGYDVDLSISSGKLGVHSIAISYNSAAGPVEIVAVYSYTAE